jgi:cytochrome c-type biogenesis protein CcmH
MPTRREFIAGLPIALAALSNRAAAQQQVQTFNGPMEQDAYKPVNLPAKPGARPSMSADQRDDLEHKIKCQCGCVLDVYTCRTTDFACSVSPAMHSDVMRLVGGGYGATAIIRAFRDVYGERVLMSPPRVGFNLLGYLMPFVVLVAGAGAVAAVLRGWRARAEAAPAMAAGPTMDASPEEIERISAAMRSDK